MNQWKAYATVAVVAALMIPATAAHAEKVWINTAGGIDCDRETVFDIAPNGDMVHSPATGDEVESYCGHPATVDWSSWNGEVVFVETLNAPAPVAPAPPAPAPVAPAPVIAPVVIAPVEVSPEVEARWGHYLFTLAV